MKTDPPRIAAFETGHGRDSGRYAELAEVALQDAFLLDALGRSGTP